MTGKRLTWYLVFLAAALVAAFCVTIPSGLMPDELDRVWDVAWDRHQCIWDACEEYAKENDGVFPPDLATLVSGGFLQEDQLSYSGWGGGRIRIRYKKPGLKSDGNEILLYDSCPTYVHGWRTSYRKYDPQRDRYGFLMVTTVAGRSQYTESWELDGDIGDTPAGGQTE